MSGCGLIEYFFEKNKLKRGSDPLRTTVSYPTLERSASLASRNVATQLSSRHPLMLVCILRPWVTFLILFHTLLRQTWYLINNHHLQFFYFPYKYSAMPMNLRERLFKEDMFQWYKNNGQQQKMKASSSSSKSMNIPRIEYIPPADNIQKREEIYFE